MLHALPVQPDPKKGATQHRTANPTKTQQSGLLEDGSSTGTEEIIRIGSFVFAYHNRLNIGRWVLRKAAYAEAV